MKKSAATFLIVALLTAGYLHADDRLSATELPSGIEFLDGSLYVGAVSRILHCDNIESLPDGPPDPVVVTDKLTSRKHHGWKYLRFGPDGNQYIPVGAPRNICEKPGFAEIRRMNPDDALLVSDDSANVIYRISYTR